MSKVITNYFMECAKEIKSCFSLTFFDASGIIFVPLSSKD